jgi:hypothetical protein
MPARWPRWEEGMGGVMNWVPDGSRSGATRMIDNYIVPLILLYIYIVMNLLVMVNNTLSM